MDCNKEEASRAKDIAERKMENRDFAGARKIALKAQKLYPDLENIAQMLVVCDVHCSSEKKVFGNEIDWYEMLQVEQTAVDAMIKKQYRKFALQLHPDKNKFPGAEAAFKLIGEAQRVLLDREKRSLFDMKRKVPMNKPATHLNSTVRSNVWSNFTCSNVQQQQQYRQATPQQQAWQATQQQQSRQATQQQQYRQATQQQQARQATQQRQSGQATQQQQYRQEPQQQQYRQATQQQQSGQATQQQQYRQEPQQEQYRQATQQQKNGGRATFWTICPFCSFKYLYFKDILNRPLHCPNCKKPFISYEVKVHGSKSSPATTNSTRQASDQQKDGSNHDAFSAGSQGNSHADKSNTRHFDKKGPTNVSEKPKGKRKKKQVEESSESADSRSSSDSDGDIVTGKGVFSGVENHSTFREENPRRSTRKRREVSYNENFTNEENDENHGKTTEMNDQNGLASDKKGEHEVEQKQHLYSKENLLNSNEDAVYTPTVYWCPDSEFSDFDKDKKKEAFAMGQIWAVYDTTDCMPRFYAIISKVLSIDFKLEIRWLEPQPEYEDEINWLKKDLPVACGIYKFGGIDITEDPLMFSHLVFCEKIGRKTFKMYPRKGETWALFKNWDIKWYLDVESHQQYEFEFVEILTDYDENEGVYVAYLAKLKGFVSLFQNMKEDNNSFQIPPQELFRFSHRVPSFKMTGEEGVGVPTGSYELDSASLPENLEDIAVAGNF